VKGSCKDCESYNPEKMSIDTDSSNPGMRLKGCCCWSDPTTVVTTEHDGHPIVASGWPHVGPNDSCGFFDTGKDA
jgi:hypothetical protein